MLIGLALATNDLLSNLHALRKFDNSENSYFFWSSLAIIRETASLVKNIDGSELRGRISKASVLALEELSAELLPFEEDSLTRKVLKPIRDNTFHYNFMNAAQNGEVQKVLHELKKGETLSVALNPGDSSLLGQRYPFADDFRSDIGNRYLSTETVKRISAISVAIGGLVDCLISDFTSNKRTI